MGKKQVIGRKRGSWDGWIEREEERERKWKVERARGKQGIAGGGRERGSSDHETEKRKKKRVGREMVCV